MGLNSWRRFLVEAYEEIDELKVKNIIGKVLFIMNQARLSLCPISHDIVILTWHFG